MLLMMDIKKKYNTVHEREIEFYPEQFKFVGTDKILSKKQNLILNLISDFILNPM